MVKEYTNDNVFDFLSKECLNKSELWNEYGSGILSHIQDVGFGIHCPSIWTVSVFAMNVGNQ